MTSDLQRFLRAVRTLAKLGMEYPDDASFVDALNKHATKKQKDQVLAAADLLDGVMKALLRQRHAEPERRCRQRGKDLEGRWNVEADGVANYIWKGAVRTDAQFCGAACRMRAHRKRVTARAKNAKAKRNGITASNKHAAGIP